MGKYTHVYSNWFILSLAGSRINQGDLCLVTLYSVRYCGHFAIVRAIVDGMLHCNCKRSAGTEGVIVEQHAV